MKLNYTLAFVACMMADTLMAGTFEDFLAENRPEDCAVDAEVNTKEISGVKLHSVFCRPTAQDRLYFIVAEKNDDFSVLRFQSAPSRQTVSLSADGAPVLVATEDEEYETLLPWPYVNAQSGVISFDARIPEGLGGGRLTRSYRLGSHFGQDFPILMRLSYQDLEAPERTLWPVQDRDESPDNLIGLTLPEETAANPLDLLRLLQLEFAAYPDGEKSRLKIRLDQAYGKIRFRIEDAGWADDSVAGQVFSGLLVLDDGLWRFESLGKLWICYRGSERYSTETCG